jgi:gliding motility-associated-like protein
LDFNPGSPVALTNGQLYNYEGCASISDNSGNLLFYTNGIQIWDRNHVVMPNGSGLMGHNSSSQSAIIVPDPGNTTKYYVFTLAELAGPNGMRYSIVDMTLNSGNGDVTAVKNVPLHPSTSEKVTAIQRCDGSVWVISHEWGTNRFFADLVTGSGINPSVVSGVGTIHTGGSNGTWNSVGYLKASQQGNRLALAIRDMHLFEVFDFDITTGIISNPITLVSQAWNVVYGVEFSPDGTKLYGSEILGKKIHQFDLTSGSAAAILASATIVGTMNTYPGAIQLGPDNKIYVARDITSTIGMDSLAVINNPNALGLACNYINNGIYLGTGLCLAGLPNFMVKTNAAGALNLSVAGSTTICQGDSTTLTASGASVFSWTGGIISSEAEITVAPLTTTTYYIAGSDSCSVANDSVIVNVVTPVMPQFEYTTSPCSDKVVFRNLTQGSQAYEWNFGDGNNSNATSPVHSYPAGTYDVQLITNPGSSCSDTIVQNINVEGTTSDIWIPNAFTPNADGKNEHFIIYGAPECFSGKLYIFDRWGELIWQTNSPMTEFWDGRYKGHLVENGIYVWKLAGEDEIRHGHVSVIR